jgi:RNA polymerase-binding transcription factor DksA
MDELDYAWEQVETFTKAALSATLIRGSSSAPSSGICRMCRMPIEPARLAANPHARDCCDCAAEEEALRQRRRRCGPSA